MAGRQSGGTFPWVVTRWGGIGLTTIDDNGTVRAYLRHPNGTYLQIQPPGATTTTIGGINASGQVAGAYVDGQHKEHGYIRNTDGTYLTLDPPGSTGLTYVVGINDKGQIAGNAFIGGNVSGFFWDPAQPNNYVTFTVPGGTFRGASAINASGQIAGGYTDSSTNEPRGFLRNTDGTFSTFTVPGSTQLVVYAMNKWGTITGSSFDQGVTNGFLRYAGGGQKYYEDQSHGGPEAAAINDNGLVVGWLFSDGGNDVAFSTDRSLTTTLIPVPFSNQGCRAYAANNAGQIAGTYVDATGVSHGWIYQP